MEGKCPQPFGENANEYSKISEQRMYWDNFG